MPFLVRRSSFLLELVIDSSVYCSGAHAMCMYASIRPSPPIMGLFTRIRGTPERFVRYRTAATHAR